MPGAVVAAATVGKKSLTVTAVTAVTAVPAVTAVSAAEKEKKKAERANRFKIGLPEANFPPSTKPHIMDDSGAAYEEGEEHDDGCGEHDDDGEE